jgi:hypothetical protein
MTIAPFDRPLKDNRGLSTPKGQFSSRCQTRVRGTHCPPFRHRQTRRGVPPARDLRPSVSLRARFRRSRPSAFTSVSHWHSSGQIVTSNLAKLRWSTCSTLGQHVPQPRPTAFMGIKGLSFYNLITLYRRVRIGQHAGEISAPTPPAVPWFQTNVCFKQVASRIAAPKMTKTERVWYTPGPGALCRSNCVLDASRSLSV